MSVSLHLHATRHSHDRLCLNRSAQRLINLELLSSLSLDFACLVVVNGNGGGETTFCWNHDLGCVGLQRGSGHVQDEIFVPECDDGAVPLVRMELFRAAGDGHCMLPSFFWRSM